jgi:4,5-DOPA dioxygenase extradiol
MHTPPRTRLVRQPAFVTVALESSMPSSLGRATTDVTPRHVSQLASRFSRKIPVERTTGGRHRLAFHASDAVLVPGADHLLIRVIAAETLVLVAIQDVVSSRLERSALGNKLTVTWDGPSVTENAPVSAGWMPAIFLSHGARPLADDPIRPGQLASWSGSLPRPTAILIVSAHWEEAPLALGATSTMPLIYDFWGCPEDYRQVRYAAPGAPDLAESVRKLLRSPGMAVWDFPDRDLDHGAYVPLVEMYPGADVPVLQISMPFLDPAQLIKIGQRLAPLRDEAVLIIHSGFFTHNLHALSFDNEVSSTMAEFDAWGQRVLEAHDLDSFLDFQHRAPAAHPAHPRTDHSAPLFVTLGASHEELATQDSVINGFWLVLAKRSIQFHSARDT